VRRLDLHRHRRLLTLRPPVTSGATRLQARQASDLRSILFR
jgi:hypothetical protein